MSRLLLAYAPHMLRDYLLTRGGAMLVVSLVFVGPSLIGIQVGEATPEQAHSAALQIILSVTPFLALIGSYGLIGQDFRLGYFRALFSKPISVPLYYATMFACAEVGFWIVLGLVLLLYAVMGVNAWDAAVMLEASMRFSMLATITFAFSRFSRLDWIFAFFLFSLASPLRDAYPASESIRGWILNVVLPPLHLLDLDVAQRRAGQLTALVTDAGVVWESVAWISVYSVIAFAIALCAARYVPLASAN